MPLVPIEWIGPDNTFASKVPGLDDIATVAIPYARLPGRAATAYRPRYTYWADLADELMEDLMALRGAGERTLRATVAVASETVAAHRAARGRRRLTALAAAHILLDRVDPTDRTMLTRLAFPPDPVLREQAALVAAELGVDPAWFDRNRPRAKRRFAEMLVEPAHSDAIRHADALRTALGPYTPSYRVLQQLRELRLDPGSVEAQMYLYIAGPYVPRGDWHENRALGGESAVLAIVDRAFEQSPVQTDGKLTSSLVDAGMPALVVPTFLATFFNLRRLNEVWVQWGATSREQAEAILHAMGKPMTGADIHALTDIQPLTLDTLMRTLSTDERFVRASRTTWALRAWGVDEYRSVVDEIGRRIDAGGGRVRTADVVADILTTVPDVAENTVRTYLSALAFIIENGTVRRRRDDDPLPAQPHWNTARGTFKHGNTIRLALPVTGEMLRGSGTAILAAAAAGVGAQPGQRRSFRTAVGEVAVVGPELGDMARERVLEQLACAGKLAHVHERAREVGLGGRGREVEAGGQDLRIAYAFVGDPSVPPDRWLVVEVGETLEKRSQLSNKIIASVILPQFVIIPLAVVLVWFGLSQGLQPLTRLRERIEARAENDLSPIRTRRVPEELQPLIDAFNAMLERMRGNLEAQHRFIADAAHQMRTPLTGLKTQAQLAMRESDPAELKNSLRQIATSVDRAAHLVNQLLTLARAEASDQAQQALEPLDLDGILRGQVEDLFFIEEPFAELGVIDVLDSLFVVDRARLLKGQFLQYLIDHRTLYDRRFSGLNEPVCQFVGHLPALWMPLPPAVFERQNRQA